MSDDRGLALLTTDDIPGGSLYLADFKDTHALVFSKTGHFLGISEDRGVRLGGHPLRMMDGIWYITEDQKIGETMTDLVVEPEALELRFIR